MQDEPGSGRALGVFRGACAVVALVAGLAGSVMMVAPADTDRYFSWPIGPPPLAALVGGFYLASALTFAVLGLRGDWAASRGVCFGILAFTLPTLGATVHHHDLFDWDRWQALAWVALFVGSPLAFASFLFLLRGRAGIGGDPLPSLGGVALGVLAGCYGLLALGLLFAPARLEDASPFALPGLSGRFLGSWCAFLAVVAAFALVRNRRHEAAAPLMALVLWPAVAIVAALRSFDDLQPSSRRLSYLLLLVAVAVLAGAVAATIFRLGGGTGSGPSRHEHGSRS